MNNNNAAGVKRLLYASTNSKYTQKYSIIASSMFAELGLCWYLIPYLIWLSMSIHVDWFD